MTEKFKEEMREWRKVIAEVIQRLDRPTRLDKNWTRGRYGVAYDPERPSERDG